jgi:tight adherence protein C
VTLAVILGTGVGIGCIGIVLGLRSVSPTLLSIAESMNSAGGSRSAETEAANVRLRLGRSIVAWVEESTRQTGPRWAALRASLAITGVLPEELAAKVLVGAGSGIVAPPLLWAMATMAGLSVSPDLPLLLAVTAVPTGICLPIIGLVARARDRRRHFRVIIGSFVDLVVLGLAGGVGIEGAMFAAAGVSNDWAARRMMKALLTGRDSGVSLWVALGQLGEEIAVPELVELSTALELAGTEGARIRQSLTARAISFRRHEQADAESEAHSTTERLFLPGVLLLVGFLLFIGYPAFSRILGGL